jgi:hypothetical protein
MKTPSIEVTYRRGRAIAAYVSFGLGRSAKCHETREAAPGLIVDFARNGKALGLEMVSPQTCTLPAVNKVLKSVGLPPLRRADFAPLCVA